MSTQFKWPLPEWLAEIKDDAERQDAEARFYLALAAVYCSRRGSLELLAVAAGGKKGSIKTHQGRPLPGPKLAIGIERALGRELFPRELFRPDLFAGE